MLRRPTNKVLFGFLGVLALSTHPSWAATVYHDVTNYAVCGSKLCNSSNDLEDVTQLYDDPALKGTLRYEIALACSGSDSDTHIIRFQQCGIDGKIIVLDPAYGPLSIPSTCHGAMTITSLEAATGCDPTTGPDPSLRILPYTSTTIPSTAALLEIGHSSVSVQGLNFIQSGGDGIQITASASATAIAIQSNGFGAVNKGDGTYTLSSSYGNAGAGVRMTAGGGATIEGNTFANNKSGVVLGSSAGQNNLISENDFYPLAGSSGLHIDLVPSGTSEGAVTPVDGAVSSGTGPNKSLRYPYTLTAALNSTDNKVYLSGYFDAGDGTLEIYNDTDTVTRGGGTYVTQIAVTPDSKHAFSVSLDSTGFSVGEILSLIGRDGSGNTSEFSAPVTIVADVDSDGDGQTPSQGDCNDSDDTVYTGATELCDGVDNDCNGQTDETCDNDNDDDGDGYTVDEGDCNDDDAAIHPGATEVCDGVDNNCDASIDEGVKTTYYFDLDGDGHGGDKLTRKACSAPPHFSTTNDDCNDRDVSIYPGATELCDGVDNDCDGQTDEGATTFYYQDADGDTYGNPNVIQAACTLPSGYVANNTDCSDSDTSINPGASEVCNGKDDNCNGEADDGITCLGTADSDDDGDGQSENQGDCNDSDPAVYVGATETCDGEDNNCDGQSDEGATTTYYQDADSDGYGNVNVSQAVCTQPTGYVTDNTDCDDTTATINLGATESCDSLDNNCNGQIDEGLNCTGGETSADDDGDGYSLDQGDCDDTAAAINPGATESCDSLDNNCDGQIDEGLSCTAGESENENGPDDDGDGYVDSDQGGDDCNDYNSRIHPDAIEMGGDGIDNNCNGEIDEDPNATDDDGDGYSEYQGDCDDSDPAINPGAAEISDDGIDNDCNGYLAISPEPDTGEAPPAGSEGQLSGGVPSGCSLVM